MQGGQINEPSLGKYFSIRLALSVSALQRNKDTVKLSAQVPNKLPVKSQQIRIELVPHHTSPGLGGGLGTFGGVSTLSPGLDGRDGDSRDPSLLEDSLSPAGPVDLNSGQEGDVRRFGIGATGKEHSSQVVTETSFLYMRIALASLMITFFC